MTTPLTALLQQYPGVQLATLVEAPPTGSDWVHEIKLDGYRLLGFRAGTDVLLRTRNGLDWTAKFPPIAEALHALKAKTAVLDMEAVVLDASGKSSFQALQASLKDGAKRAHIVAFAFDLLHLDGQDLTRLELTARKQKLEALLKKSPAAAALKFSQHFTGDATEILAQSCRLGLEGIISKLSRAPYTAARDRTWLKAKCTKRQEFIIVGYSDARSGDRSLGALYLAYNKEGALRYAGKVGTGFTMKSAQSLADQFAPVTTDKPVFTRPAMGGISSGEWAGIHWLKGQLLCEVAFTEWTDDGRIRHPSFQGLREDKSAADVNMETPAKVSTRGIRKRPA